MSVRITNPGTTPDAATRKDYVDGLATTIAASTQTASYTLALTDLGRVVEVNATAANTVTVPPNSAVAFPIGAVLEVVQYGAGQTTITAGVGVTLRSPAGLKIAAQYGTVSLRQRAANEWIVSGYTTP